MGEQVHFFVTSNCDAISYVIENAHVKTMAGQDIENGCVLIGDNGKIVSVGDHVIWQDDPMTSVGASAHVTIVDGKVAYRYGDKE